MGGEAGVIASAVAALGVALFGYLRTRKSRGQNQLSILETVNNRQNSLLASRDKKIAELEAGRDADRRRIWHLEDEVAELRREVERLTDDAKESP